MFTGSSDHSYKPPPGCRVTKKVCPPPERVRIVGLLRFICQGVLWSMRPNNASKSDKIQFKSKENLRFL